MRTIQQASESFFAKVFPDGPLPANQKREMERAFYAGAHAALHLMFEIADDERISEEAQTALLEGLFAETEQYALDVFNGRR